MFYLLVHIWHPIGRHERGCTVLWQISACIYGLVLASILATLLAWVFLGQKLEIGRHQLVQQRLLAASTPSYDTKLIHKTVTHLQHRRRARIRM